MRNFHSYRPQLQALSIAPASRRSWIPTPLHLLVGVDPTRWSQRARDERWHAPLPRATRN